MVITGQWTDVQLRFFIGDPIFVYFDGTRGDPESAYFKAYIVDERTYDEPHCEVVRKVDGKKWIVPLRSISAEIQAQTSRKRKATKYYMNE